MAGKSRTTAEGMAALESKHGPTIAAAREIAVELCRANGSTHSRAVRAEMARRGLITGHEGREHWLGAIFMRSVFEWTGEWVTYADVERCVHERTIKVWKLRAPSSSSGGEHKGRSRSASTPTSKGTRPPEGPRAPAVSPTSKPLACMQLDLLAGTR